MNSINNNSQISSKKWLNIILIGFLFISCQQEQKGTSGENTITLSEYSVVVSNEDFLIGVPSIIRIVDSETILIYDSSTKLVYELDLQNKKKQAIGREGRGPGEYLRVSNEYFLLQADENEQGKEMVLLNRIGEPVGKFLLSNSDEIHDLKNQSIYTLNKDQESGHSVRIYELSLE